MRNTYKDLVYLDVDGHCGSAVGLTLIDVASMDEDTRYQFEQALDRPNGVREFVYEQYDHGAPSSSVYVEGNGIVISKRLAESAGPIIAKIMKQ